MGRDEMGIVNTFRTAALIWSVGISRDAMFSENYTELAGRLLERFQSLPSYEKITKHSRPNCWFQPAKTHLQ